MSGNRALGLGLVTGGGVLGGVMLLWLLVSLLAGDLTPGGAVLGLLIAAVLGLPLIGGGLYVLSRGKAVAAEERQFRVQRRTFEADRLFRAEQARELEQLARRVAALDGTETRQVASRLRDLIHDLQAPAYDQAAWYEAVDLGRADVDALDRYDALLSDAMRRMASLVDRVERDPATLPELRRAVESWERDAGHRADLLRGRRAPVIAPTDLLGLGPGLSSSEAFAALKVGDAVSLDDTDYLIETSVSYFSGGRTTWLHRLVSERDEGWLYVGPGGLSLAWLEPVQVAAEPGTDTFAHDGATCRLDESFLADARVLTRAGQESSGTVTIWRYACVDGHMLWIERWPNRTRAYSGRPLKPTDLEVWPAAVDEHAASEDPGR